MTIDPVVSTADLALAPALAELHLRAALAGYGHIFPAEALPPTIEELLAQWEHWLGPDRANGRRAFVAHAGAALVGVVLAGPDPVEPELGHLARLYVTPDLWGDGIGGHLYRAAMDHMRDAGFDAVTLWVLERNHRARAWYERLGWQPTGERKPAFAPAGIDDLRYRISLR
jgi:ribosomal protein S18 acetylase RimI-like enzyme